MAATGTPTPNIGLRIPQGTDPASVDDINYNSNLLDTKLGAVGNTSVQDQIDSLNSNLSSKSNVMELNVPANGSATIPFQSPALRGIAFNNSGASARMGLWIIYITSTGATIREIVSSDVLSLAQGNDGLVISNSSNAAQMVRIMY